MATCPACGKPIPAEGGFIVAQGQSVTCACKAVAQIASAPVSTPQLKGMDTKIGILAGLFALGTTKLGEGTQACIFASGGLVALCALNLSGNRYGQFFDFFARLALSITMCCGLWTAVRGITRQTLPQQRVLAIVAGIVLMVLLVITILSMVALAQKIRWVGHGWTPFM